MVACMLWVIGTLITHIGIYMIDKTIKLPLGGLIIACGAAVQFAAFIMLQ